MLLHFHNVACGTFHLQRLFARRIECGVALLCVLWFSNGLYDCKRCFEQAVRQGDASFGSFYAT